MSAPRVDPDLFRMKVGQYGDRWYCDPLPGCDIAEQDLEWRGPSVSLVKKATGKDWSAVNLSRLASWLVREQPSFAGMDFDLCRDTLQGVIDGLLNKASERGTQVHSMFEADADGVDLSTVQLGEDAKRYAPTVHRLLELRRPTVALSEFVCISRTLDYGGTADSVWFLRDPDDEEAYWLVDYKSRENHNLYIEECWQLGAYARADYWISARLGPHHQVIHERMWPLELKGGLIVSVTPDQGHRIHPVNLDVAFEGFRALLDLWKVRSAGVRLLRFGPPWPDVKRTRDMWVRDRIETIKDIDIAPLLRQWPDDVPKPKKIDTYTDEHIDALIPVLDLVERAIEAPFPEADPDPPNTEPEQPELSDAEPDTLYPVLVDEGDLMPSALVVVRHRFSQLSTPQVDFIQRTVREAADAGVPIRVAEEPTARRIFIARALILACERRIAAHTFTGMLDSIQDPTDFDEDTVTLGERLGSLDWEQASVLAGLCSMAGPVEADEPPATEIAVPWDSYTKPELKEMCRERGLPVGGTKPDLISRLTQA